MRKLLFFMLFGIILSSINCGGAKRIINNNAIRVEDYVISNDYVVYKWRELGKGQKKTSLSALNLTTGKTVLLESGFSSGHSAIDGDLIASITRDTSNSSIKLYDLKSKRKKEIASGRAGHVSISGERVVWDHKTKQASSIKLYDIKTKKLQDITQPIRGIYDSKPTIDDNLVVWMRKDVKSRKNSLYLYDLRSRKTKKLPISASKNIIFKLSGGVVAYRTFPKSSNLIQLFTVETGENKTVVKSSRLTGSFAFRNNTLVWLEYMSKEDFKKSAARPLINEEDFITVYKMHLNEKKTAKIASNVFSARHPVISGEGNVYVIKNTKKDTSVHTSSNIYEL